MMGIKALNILMYLKDDSLAQSALRSILSERRSVSAAYLVIIGAFLDHRPAIIDDLPSHFQLGERVRKSVPIHFNLICII